jgi:hypothetical protein
MSIFSSFHFSSSVYYSPPSTTVLIHYSPPSSTLLFPILLLSSISHRLPLQLSFHFPRPSPFIFPLRPLLLFFHHSLHPLLPSFHHSPPPTTPPLSPLPSVTTSLLPLVPFFHYSSSSNTPLPSFSSSRSYFPASTRSFLKTFPSFQCPYDSIIALLPKLLPSDILLLLTFLFYLSMTVKSF